MDNPLKHLVFSDTHKKKNRQTTGNQSSSGSCSNPYRIQNIEFYEI